MASHARQAARRPGIREPAAHRTEQWAADGRTAPELQAKSRHQHLASLGRYVQLSEQTSARVTAEADPAACRRAR